MKMNQFCKDHICEKFIEVKTENTISNGLPILAKIIARLITENIQKKTVNNNSMNGFTFDNTKVL